MLGVAFMPVKKDQKRMNQAVTINRKAKYSLAYVSVAGGINFTLRSISGGYGVKPSHRIVSYWLVLLVF